MADALPDGATDDPTPAEPRPDIQPSQGLLLAPARDAGLSSEPGEGDTTTSAEADDRFHVHLDVFAGPFELLLQLIAKHRLDVTEVALAAVTDEFLARARSLAAWDLEETTEFLVVAATLLDLKAARLLPQAEVEDTEDLQLLEARDLLFARLLQYRAYKEVAARLGEQLERHRRHPRSVGPEPHLRGLQPEVVLGLGPEAFALLAARVLAPRRAAVVDVEHVHAAPVSVREQAVLVLEVLHRAGSASFRTLTADCPTTLHVVARFLALLDLYREGSVAFDQVGPLAELQVRLRAPGGGPVSEREAPGRASPDHVGEGSGDDGREQ